jgi:hypothetical protein
MLINEQEARVLKKMKHMQERRLLDRRGAKRNHPTFTHAQVTQKQADAWLENWKAKLVEVFGPKASNKSRTATHLESSRGGIRRH